jgi:hypothetical protein
MKYTPEKRDTDRKRHIISIDGMRRFPPPWVRRIPGGFKVLDPIKPKNSICRAVEAPSE